MKQAFRSIKNKSSGRLSIGQWLLFSCSFSIVLLLARVLTSNHFSYVFLAWNLFLAFVPYFISRWLEKHPGLFRNRLKLGITLFAWLLFIPNSFYILTDLFHLHTMGNGHPWFDLTMIFSFAWNGIVFGILSIRKMELLLRKIKGRLVAQLMICAVMWLSAFGVYVGRYLRFNSWDVLFNPFGLVSSISDMFFDPYDHRYVWAMSFCFGCLMLIIYFTIKKLGDVFRNS